MEFTPDEQAFIDAQTEVLRKQAVTYEAMKEEEIAADRADEAALKIRDESNPDIEATMNRAKVLFEAAFRQSGLPTDHDVIVGARRGLAAAREMMEAYEQSQIDALNRGDPIL